ncbi:hypothetical protein [Pseudonocardia sp. Ae717_Ps2]|uniref:hypothetical protein n=1 Tax=Pseudonocardia sp. Ae717_Ps2 TaxID=1885573 RepID=UPI00094AF4FF|nr:hypothetical protein [Pseudonocardia sp. Ae717_Ps2]
MSATAEHGIDVRVGNGAVEKMGKYISKLAFETAGGRWKRGKRGSRTPFQILADAIDTGNERDVALWQEWEQGSHGMQQLVWSNGLKQRCGVTEVKDEEIAEEDGGGELAGVLPARSWKKIYPVAEDLIIATRHGGVPAARAWLDARGLAFEFEADTTERAVQLDPGDAPFAWLKAALSGRRPRTAPGTAPELLPARYGALRATARTARTARTYASSDDLRPGAWSGWAPPADPS